MTEISIRQYLKEIEEIEKILQELLDGVEKERSAKGNSPFYNSWLDGYKEALTHIAKLCGFIVKVEKVGEPKKETNK